MAAGISTVLVTGGDGFVGRALCPALAAAGRRVRISSRRPAPAAGIEVCRVADIGPDTDWSAALEGIDAVVYLAARVHVMDERHGDPLAEYRRVNAEGTRRLAEAASAAGVRRLVLLSTVKVNGETTPGAPFRDGDPPHPREPYGVSKLEAERALFEVAAGGALEATVLRPPLVYGAGVKGNFLELLELCAKAPPLPLAGIANRRSLIHAANLADAVLRCLDHPGAAGKTYLVADGEPVSTPELVRRLAAALGRPARLFPVPGALLRLAGAVTGKAAAVERLCDSLIVDDGKIRLELDWTPPLTMVQGLEETASWFLSRERR